MSELPARTEAEALADVIGDLNLPTTIEILKEPKDSIEVLAVPRGLRLESVKQFTDQYLKNPERKKGFAKLKDLASFVAHANRFKDKGSALFANPDAPAIFSVLDYHLEGTGVARFGEHRGLYECPLSDEWKAWTAREGQKLNQQDLAEFLEDRILDVIDPATAGDGSKKIAETLGCSFATPQKLLELSRGLTVHVSAKVRQVTNLATGEASMQFEDEHKGADGAPLKIPGAFFVAIPVFKNGPLYQIAARLRYRVVGPSVTWFYQLHGVDRVFDHAFKEACDTAQKETGLPLFVGTPE